MRKFAKRHPRLVLIGLTILLLLPLLTSWIVWSEDVNIDPVATINNYTSFLGTLLSVLFGFVIINVLWERRSRADKTMRIRRLLAGQIASIAVISEGIVQAIAHHTRDEATSLLRDQKMATDAASLRTAVASLTSLTTEIPVEDSQLREGCLDLVRVLDPLASKLVSSTQSHEALSELRKLADSINSLAKSSLQSFP